MLISNKNVNLSLFIMMVTDFVLALGFVVTRAQMVSYVIFLALIYILELYVKTDKTKFLWWIPVLSIVQINLHASLWWMLILVLGVFIVDSFKKPKKYLQGYRTKPLIIVTVLTFLTGLINPYGLNMITFIFKSYGDQGFHGMVRELSSFSPFNSVIEAFVYISIVGVLMLYIFGKNKNIRFRYLLMFFGFLALGLNTVKGLSQFILVMFFPLALSYEDVRLEKVFDAKIARDAVVSWVGIVCIAFFVAMCPMVVSRVRAYPDEVFVDAVDVIDDNSVGEDRKLLKVYTGYNDGGYLEYRGYKPYLDPRGEVFLKKTNDKEDILHEWEDFKKGKIDVLDFLGKYDFDYILAVREDDPFYDFENENYEMIFENEEKEVRVFKRK